MVRSSAPTEDVGQTAKKRRLQMPSTSIHELAIQQVERLSRRGFQRLALRKPLENAFEHSTLARRCERLWLEGLIAIGLFNIYVLVDHFLQGSSSWLPIQIRLCIVTPLA